MRSGERIGNYTILSKIGEGGMSVVYLAEHASEGTRVVVKELKEQHRFNEQLVDRFLREAEILQSLRHPHLARIFDVLLHEGKHCIIQEHLSGGSLADILRENKPYSEQEAIRWCCDALRAMNYAHENGIVHRDLKPSNLMLDDRRQVRVIDFGIARAFGQERLTRTSDGSIGTLEYMSPEQFLSPNQIDHLTDVYSMGVVLYELLSGSVPFEGPTPFSIQEKIARHAPPPLKRAREITPLRSDGNGIDPQLTRIVFRALEKRPDRRFGGCAEFALQLEQYLTQTRPPGVLTRVARRPLALLLILIVALTAWWAWANSSTSSDRRRQEQKQQEADRQALIQKQQEADRQAQIQKQQEADRQAQIQKQLEADRQAQIQKQQEADRQAQMQKQQEADRQALIRKQQEADRQAQVQKEREADRQALIQKQQEAERQALIQKQREADRQALIQKQQEADRLALIQKQQEVDRQALMLKQEADRLALIQKQQEADRLALIQKQQEADRLALIRKQQEADRQAQVQKEREAARQEQIQKEQEAARQAQIEAERQRRLQQQRAAAQFFRSVMGTWTREETDQSGNSRTGTRTIEVLNIGSDCSGLLTRTVTTYARGYAGWKEVNSRTERFTIRCDATGRVWGDVNTHLSPQGETLLFGRNRFTRRR